jgi:aspartate/methionine/tyrosine aminotransferase
VCNPHNPLGRPYPRETLLSYAKFCEERDLHLVSDEIYALSVYDNPSFPDAVPFTSMLSLDVERELGIPFDRARVHVVYGMSKECVVFGRMGTLLTLSFCANGLRVGSLISQANPLLLRAMANTSMLMKISSPADVIWSTLLADTEKLTEFVALNRERLTEAAQFVRDWFEARGVQVANSNA